MSDTLYIKIGQKIRVGQPLVRIGDLGDLWCSDASAAAGCRALFFTSLQGRRTVSDVLQVTKVIQEAYPSLTVENLGETDFIMEYVEEKQKHPLWEWTKAGLVCLIIFFGAAFSIMTFNADVSVDQVFSDLHFLLTGQERAGMTWLEIGYAAGLFLGILIFYNHFRSKRRRDDPTPLEVEMRSYEREVNQTVLDEEERIFERRKRTGEADTGGKT